jgi:hypothetical protein
MPHRHRLEGLLPLDDHDRPQSLFSQPLNCWRFGVLRLHPLTRATRLISRALPLRHVPFEPHATRSKMSGPSASRCSLSCTPCPACASSRPSVVLRRSSGSRQRDAIVAVRCSSELLDGPPTSRDHQRVDPTVRELVLLALLSAFLCVVALIYADPIPTAVFAALTSGCVVIAAGLSRGSWT